MYVDMYGAVSVAVVVIANFLYFLLLLITSMFQKLDHLVYKIVPCIFAVM